jgi:ParB/RepB/Spo0J family partition protein
MSQLIEVARLDFHPDNPPSRSEADPELAASLQTGQLQALLVEPTGDGTRYVVIDGNRRLLAARATGRTQLECTIRGRTNPLEHTIARLSANGHRRGMLPLDEARDFDRLRTRHGLTVAQIVERTGFPTATVRARLDLLQLDEKTQQLVADGRLTLGAAQQAVQTARGHHTAATGPAAAGRPRPRQTTPPWFGPQHPLAGEAGRLCRATHQRVPGKLGGIACGEHWEVAIRTEASPAEWTADDVAGLLAQLADDDPAPAHDEATDKAAGGRTPRR